MKKFKILDIEVDETKVRVSEEWENKTLFGEVADKIVEIYSCSNGGDNEVMKNLMQALKYLHWGERVSLWDKGAVEEIVKMLEGDPKVIPIEIKKY